MKKIPESIKASFIIIGSCIGAGFVSGQEIVRFFNNEKPIFSCLIACLLFFLISFLLLILGERYKTSYVMNKCLFKSAGNFVNIIIIFVSLIITASMLAGVESLFSEFFMIDKKFCYFAIIFIILANIVCNKGVKGIGIINTILIPVLIVFLFYFLIRKSDFSFQGTPYKAGGYYKGILYACMNMLLVSPVLVEEGTKLKKKSDIIASFISAFILLLCLVLILSSIIYEGAGAINSDLPLLYVLSGEKASKIIFGILMLVGIFTSLVSSYYPVNNFFINKFGERGKYSFMLIVFLLSRLGLKNIVTYIYPALGGIGLVYFISITIIQLAKKKRYKDLKCSK